MQKKPNKPRVAHESLEAKHTSVNASISDISSAGLDALWKDLLGAGTKDIFGQLTGSYAHELKPGEAHHIGASHEKPKEEKKPVTEGHMEYFRGIKNADIAPSMAADAETARRVDEIRDEIKKLMTLSTELNSTFKSVSVEKAVVKAGKYHETFFMFVLSLLRSARIKMEEGSAWMNTSKSKKQQKQYQSMAKKHGTSFTLNNERTAATQTG